jgi:cobalamin biosynthesis protein CobD/CbiB
MGDGRAAATTDDLTRALKLYRTACGIQIAVAFIGLLIARG